MSALWFAIDVAQGLVAATAMTVFLIQLVRGKVTMKWLQERLWWF
ncbi:hypothetical protein NGR_b16670 (plasmid) [Sinorhizobium fredii NGR234]|uniref:Uncharacterized protein n=1 Tax=Sinorhizobium fredii (strain NBRC 101917 / NGR234) TaxID=394 RepID=Q6W215_SINFN|nr:Hypothetical protein RNGR00181 [Sinorhizobium fredii NGR234]ACP23118.1 hypothetical protein NGR_b16670 [Sinorhizobium fredii NGR234]